MLISQSDDYVDCAIIVIAHNSAEHIDRFLDSIPAAAGDLRVRCLLVDNQSSDDTRAIVRRRSDVTMLDSGGNLGYSGGINVGRVRAGPCASLLFVNPDLEFEPGAILTLRNGLNAPGVGVTVPMMLRPDGQVQPTLRREPTILRALGEALFGDRLPLRPGWLSETIRDPRAYHEARDADWATGAVLCVSSECNGAVGDWDERRFFLYSEETDYAVRVRQRGYRIRYLPGARVLHEPGGSGRPATLDALASVNRLRYYEKYHGRASASLFRAVVALKHLLRYWDPDDRLALRHVCHRASWAELPGARAG
ncbi:MAG TPA: glycosyltransferase family 2 protein [Solirubrobacteraceae bacterium]|nr:glycosyltransferase family 2 protein [Solirubrobacteraceae bacterium]